jgi:hypothetical protein
MFEATPSKSGMFPILQPSDYTNVMNRAGSFTVNAGLLYCLRDPHCGPGLAYHLAKHPEERERLLKTPPSCCDKK